MTTKSLEKLAEEFNAHKPLEAFELVTLGYHNIHQTYAGYQIWKKDNKIALIEAQQTKPITYKMYVKSRG